MWVASGLFVTAFAAATVLPMSSELALIAAVQQQPHAWVWLWCVASLGNTLGSMLTVWMGRVGRKALPDAQAKRWLPRLRRIGPSLLILAWLPLVGDVLALAAGLARLAWLPVCLFLMVGKSLRYAFVLGAVDLVAR